MAAPVLAYLPEGQSKPRAMLAGTAQIAGGHAD
jgi:hypothetical protein